MDIVFHLPLQTLTRPEDGACLAGRHWCWHPEKGLAFRLVSEGQTSRIEPLCSLHPRALRRSLQELGDGYEARQVPAVFLRHAETFVPQARRDHMMALREKFLEAA